jgi:hypothetical protein
MEDHRKLHISKTTQTLDLGGVAFLVVSVTTTIVFCFQTQKLRSLATKLTRKLTARQTETSKPYYALYRQLLFQADRKWLYLALPPLLLYGYTL